MAAPAAATPDRARPVIVEILGVAGAGKSTLAADLAERLTALGFPATDSRATRRGGFGAASRMRAGLRAVPECIRTALFVAGRIARGDLPRSALSRLGPAFQHARQLRLLLGRRVAERMAVQEPGRLMDLLTQYLHTRRPLDPAAVRRYMAAGPHADVVIALRARPDVALRHMRARRRGLPQSFRALGDAELEVVLRRGDALAATLAEVCRASGMPTLEIDVDDLDAAAVTERSVAFVLPRL